MSTELRAFKRDNGQWGLRNHVLIMPLHSALSSTARAIADGSNGAVAISHDWSGEVDNDLSRIIVTLSGYAANPNNFAVLFLTVGSNQENEIIAGAASLGLKRFSNLALAEIGSMEGLQIKAIELANNYCAQASKEERVPAPWSALVLGLECGGSDALSGITANPALGVASDRLVELGATSVLGETTEILGAEHLLAARAIDPEVGVRIVAMVSRYEASINYEGIDIRGAQPSRGNIEGGLSTLEEKSLGAAKKAGNAPLTGVLEFGEKPATTGLYFMDTPGHDIEQLAGFGAGHINIVVFTSGRGTPTGSAIMPTIKVSTNTPMYQAIPDLIDLDAGTIADGLETLAQVGDRIFDEILAVANGRQTKAELGGHHEFALSRMYKTVIK
jgi:altronate dehydratase large subunit|uniref:UxaA family hydrolase n=1 Tax=Candidatus Planktophila sp. TaxID=2175601 RepID=UPI0040491E5A